VFYFSRKKAFEKTLSHKKILSFLALQKCFKARDLPQRIRALLLSRNNIS